MRSRRTAGECAQYIQDVHAELSFAQKIGEAADDRRVLDFGAGAGWFLRQLGGGWDKSAIEIDESAVALWPSDIKRLWSFGYLAYQSYDLVVCHHVIEHCEHPEHVACDLADVLRPGGAMIFATPDFDSPCAKRFGQNYRMLHDPGHISLFSRASAERFLVDHQFRILDVQYPFPERYATPENFARWNDTTKISPPWPGNWMTFYCTKSRR